jgi:hypothetical protein
VRLSVIGIGFLEKIAERSLPKAFVVIPSDNTRVPRLYMFGRWSSMQRRIAARTRYVARFEVMMYELSNSGKNVFCFVKTIGIPCKIVLEM